MTYVTPSAMRIRQRYPHASWLACPIGLMTMGRTEAVGSKEVPGQVTEHQWGIEANFTVPNLLTFKHMCVHEGASMNQPRGQEYGRLLVIQSGHAQITIGTDVLRAGPGQTIVVPPSTPLCVESTGSVVEYYEVHPRG